MPSHEAASARLPNTHTSSYNAIRRRRSALPMTDKELMVIAALAQMGLTSMPATG